jgi:crossover junction endodeoxyribonuclease RusA
MKITIRPIPPTINKYIGRSNIWEYQKDKKEIHKAIKMQTIGNNPMIKECTMRITYYFKDKRRRDVTNYDKMLLDGLVEAKIIEDDNYEVIKEITLCGKYDPIDSRVEIEIIPDNFKYDFCMKRSTCNGCRYEESCEK